jgi:hypothetical protein
MSPLLPVTRTFIEQQAYQKKRVKQEGLSAVKRAADSA